MPEDNSKSFVEHVRTVHFALLITSTALIITMLNNQSSVVRDAAAQLDAVEAAFDFLKPEGIHAFVKEVLVSNDASVSEFATERKSKVRVTWKERASAEFLLKYKAVGFSDTLTKLMETGGMSDSDRDPDSLKAFAEKWDLIDPRKTNLEVFVAATGFETTGYLVSRKSSESLKNEAFTSDEIANATPIEVESISLLGEEVMAATVDIGSGKNVSKYTAGDLGSENAEAVGFAPDGKYIFFLKPVVNEDGSKSLTSAIGMVWNFQTRMAEGPFPITLNRRNRTRPRAAISGGGSKVAANTYWASWRNRVISQNRFIHVFGRDGSGAHLLMDLLGRPPMAFVGDGAGLLTARDVGSGVTFSKFAPDGSGSASIKTFLDGVTATDICVTPDGARAVIVGNEGYGNTSRGGIWALNLASGETARLEVFKAETTVPKAAFSSDGGTVAIVADYRVNENQKSFFRLYCWKLRGGKWAKVCERNLKAKAAVACSPSGEKVAIAMSDEVYVLSGAEYASETRVATSGRKIDFLTFTSDEKELTFFFGGHVSGTDGWLSRLPDSTSKIPVVLGAEVTDSLVSGEKEGKEAAQFVVLRFSARDGKDNSGTRTYRLALQTELQRKIKGAHWRNGSFQTSFPSLATVTEQYRNLPIQQVRGILASEVSRSGETVEAFGLKIPAGALRQWGTLLILTLQLYFSRHLRFMRRTHLPGIRESMSAWIGLYDDRLSRFGTILSAVVLPALACSLLVGLAGLTDFQANRLKWWTVAIGVVSVGLSIYLAFATNRQLRRLWMELRADG